MQTAYTAYNHHVARVQQHQARPLTASQFIQLVIKIYSMRGETVKK